MKKLLLLLLCVPLIGFGQGWTKTFGGIEDDYGRSVQQTTDGGYIITGGTSSFGNGYDDVYLIKTDVNGDSLWTKTFGGIVYDYGYSVQQTTDGGYIVCGIIDSTGHQENCKGYLIKTDSLGTLQWDQIYAFFPDSQTVAFFVQQTTDGGYIICGRTGDMYSNNNDIYLIKTDSLGGLQWNQTYGGLNNDGARVVQQTTDGGYIICGYTTDVFLSYDIYLIKTDVNGDSLWTKTFGGIDSEYGMSVQQTTDGGYIICGSGGMNQSDIYLIKTDSLGTLQWDQTYGGIDEDNGYSVQQTTDGGYIIGGVTESFTFGESDIYLIKTDSLGTLQWDQTYGGIDDEFGTSVQQTTDGGYIACGGTESFGNGGYDVYLIKTDGNGNITSTFNIPIPSSNRELKNVVDILGRDINPEKNKPFIEIYNDGTVEKKMIIE